MCNKILVLALLLVASLQARESLQGECSRGAFPVTFPTLGFTSSTLVERSFPSCTVAVYVTGTGSPGTLATIYSDNSGTALANPFVASASGHWQFWADDGTYNVSLSGGGIPTPFTLYSMSLQDPFYLAPLVGSTKRLIAGKLSDVVSVKDFGAVGNGTTDDKNAIQTALDSLPSSGATLYFPRGNYKVSTSLIVHSYSKLLGDGWAWDENGTKLGQSRIFSTAAINVLTADTIQTSLGPSSVAVNIEGLTLEASGAAGSRALYAPIAVNAWIVRDSVFLNSGEECVKLGSPGINTFGGTASRLEHNLALGCVLVRTGRTDFIGAMDISIADVWLDGNELQAGVFDLSQPTFPGQGLLGDGFIAGLVVRYTGNSWITNNICELSQVGCVFIGIGPALISGNRADLNQGRGLLFLGPPQPQSFLNQLIVQGNWAYRNSMNADGQASGFYITSGEGTFQGNSCYQRSDDTGGTGFPRQGDCFEDVGTGETSSPRLGNQYSGNRSSGIKGHTYNFGGSGVVKQVFSDPEANLVSGTGGIPFIVPSGAIGTDPSKIFYRNSAGATFLALGQEALVVTAATAANPVVLTLATAPPVEWAIGATIALTGATYADGSASTTIESQCWQLNQPLSILAVSGSIVTVNLDGTGCTYKASSARAFLVPQQGNISVNMPGDAVNGRTASTRLSGRVAQHLLQDKRALPFGTNNSQWSIATNYDSATQTFNQLTFDSISDDLLSFGRFINLNRSPIAITPQNIGLMAAGGYVTIGSDAGDSAAGRGKLQIYGGSIQLDGLNFAQLGTAGFQVVWCKNCNIASPCTGSAGSGAWAFRSAGGVWKCPF